MAVPGDPVGRTQPRLRAFPHVATALALAYLGVAAAVLTVAGAGPPLRGWPSDAAWIVPFGQLTKLGVGAETGAGALAMIALPALALGSFRHAQGTGLPTAVTEPRRRGWHVLIVLFGIPAGLAYVIRGAVSGQLDRDAALLIGRRLSALLAAVLAGGFALSGQSLQVAAAALLVLQMLLAAGLGRPLRWSKSRRSSS